MSDIALGSVIPPSTLAALLTRRTEGSAEIQETDSRRWEPNDFKASRLCKKTIHLPPKKQIFSSHGVPDEKENLILKDSPHWKNTFNTPWCKYASNLFRSKTTSASIKAEDFHF